MISELVVNVEPQEMSIAVLEDKNLVELQKEARNVAFAVGDIYLGKVKKLMPGLNAAFIDVGYKKDAFLHYQDLGANFNSQQKYLKTALADYKKLPIMQKASIYPEIDKDGSIGDVLKIGQEVLVQIAKEPISTKGPRLASELSFAGRYIVLIRSVPQGPAFSGKAMSLRRSFPKPMAYWSDPPIFLRWRCLKA